MKTINISKEQAIFIILAVFILGLLTGGLVAKSFMVKKEQYATATKVINLQSSLINNMADYLITDYECETFLSDSIMVPLQSYKQKLYSYE